jgi:hypothetical protein
VTSRTSTLSSVAAELVNDQSMVASLHLSAVETPYGQHIILVEPHPSFAEKRNILMDADKSNDIAST